VGSYASQIAKHLGARVIGSAASGDIEYLKSLGVDEIIDYQRERFEDKATGVDAVVIPSEQAPVIKALLAAAIKMAKTWDSMSCSQVRAISRILINKVIVHRDRIEILVIRNGLRRSVPEERAAESNVANTKTRDLLSLVINNVSLRRCGREMRMIVPSNTNQKASHVVQSLVKAVVRTHNWRERLITGALKNLAAIAAETGVLECYVRRILPCAFLAPDIVESILDGQQPPDLTLQKLQTVPLAWANQRNAARST